MHTTQFRAMGTDVTVLTLDEIPGGAGERAADRIEQFEAKWSRFRPASEVCALNDAARNAPARVVVSPDTFALISRAVDAWRFTGGRYDPTVLPAVIAAGYDRDFDAVRREGAGPEGTVAPAPGAGGIVLDARLDVVELPARVALDLGGIGKGFAADLVARELVELGARGALVNMGGDLRAYGDAPEPHGWIVAVEDPLETDATGLLALRTGAIATSTKLRRAWERDGRALHHIIDPRTGAPADSGLASVTVVTSEAWRAEVLAKAAFLAGADDAAALLTAAGATGLLVRDDRRVIEVDGLAAFRP
jgi:thiamine biosynthesis lipoprotein